MLRATLAMAACTVTACLAQGARAACDEPTKRADLALGVTEALHAFEQLDRDGFATARDGVKASLPCLGEPLLPQDAATVHGLMALDAFLAKEDGNSVAHLSAATQAWPDYDLPAELFPAGHPLRLHLQVARTLHLRPTRPLPVPERGDITVDGLPVDLAPADRPAVLQWLLSDHQVADTAYLATGAPMPDWGPLPDPAGGTPTARPWGILAATGGTAAIAGGLWSLAAWRHARFVDPSTPQDQLPTLRGQANGLTVAASGASVLTAGMGVVAVLRW